MPRRPWSLLGGLAIALVLGGHLAVAPAQICTPVVKPMVVLINSTARLQLSSKKPIRSVVNPKEGVLVIRTIERDPTTVLLTGLNPGVTCVELEDADGNKEVYKVLVQADVEYLAAQLRCAVPLANVTPIPNGTNSVILAGYVPRIEDIQVVQAIATTAGFQPINAMRVSGVQQVQLDVVIARVERGKTRNFGFNFLQTSPNQIFGSNVGNLIPALGPIGIPGTNLQPAFLSNLVNSPPGSANLFGGIIFPNSGFLGFLEALQQENLAKILAKPRLVSLSGNTASFLDGGEQAVPIPAGLGQVGVQFEEFGTRLNFLPLVMGNGKIHLEVEPEVSILSNAGSVTLVAGGQPVQGRQTQRIHTTVELESGQTFVIGGLIQHETTAQATKVPVLGEIPFLGTFFSTKSYVDDETELVVMVTPYFVDAQSCDQVAKVLPGQETRSPDNFELFLEGILEAPRGPREIFHGNRYVPAHKNGPTAHLFPCHGGPGCGPGGCAAAAEVPVAAPAAVAAPATPVSAAPAVLPGAAVKPAAATLPAPAPEKPAPAAQAAPAPEKPAADEPAGERSSAGSGGGSQ